MVRADEHILRFMHRCDEGRAYLSCKVVAANISYDRQYVNKRIRNQLVAHDLVRDVGDGLYQLTDRGRAWVRGELDPEELS